MPLYYCSHNEFGNALPSVYSNRTCEMITYEPSKISDELKEKLNGKMGLTELSKAEVKQLWEAKYGQERVSEGVIKNLFNSKKTF